MTGNDPDPVLYRRFVNAVVDHFTHNPDGSLNVRVAAYSLWNEPNLKVFLREAESGVVPAVKYRRLYLEGRAGAHSAYSGARVFIGELSELAATGRMPGSLLGDRRQRVTAMDFLQEVVRPRSDTSPSVETEGVTLHAYQHRGAAHSAGKRLQVGIGKLNGDLIDPRDQRRGRENLTGVNRTLNLLYRRHGPSGSTSSTATGVRWLRTPGGRRPSLYADHHESGREPHRRSGPRHRNPQLRQGSGRS